MNERADQIKEQIHTLLEEYYQETFAKRTFTAGVNNVPVSGKVFDHEELQYVVESALDGWFTTGRFNDEFEFALAKFMGISRARTVNSGSSANLIAFASLTAEELGDRALKPGDEFISVAVSFPTTINPAISYGLKPVFVDVDIPTYNIDASRLEEALSPKTKAIIVAHTLGNPYNLGVVSEFARKNNLWLIEDCCDALGATYNGKHVGTFGDISTLSFYPAHHITMGEGGAVMTKNQKLLKFIESFRDWGRDCYCKSGKDNTCGKRFSWQLGDLPFGYDHKYIYSRLGYNLKITDMQAALGLAQMKKLPGFVETRRHNFKRIKEGLKQFEHKLILPEATPNANPSWFGFLITVRENAGITRNEIIQKLTEAKIDTRLLFGGDIRKQPYFKSIDYKTVGDMTNTEIVMHRTFWIGVTPMINDTMIDYMIDTFTRILK
jgi:CDP-4-dehydro-6-deoxyglucose reductase, E1